jgi:hypothetical protein
MTAFLPLELGLSTLNGHPLSQYRRCRSAGQVQVGRLALPSDLDPLGDCQGGMHLEPCSNDGSCLLWGD